MSHWLSHEIESIGMYRVVVLVVSARGTEQKQANEASG